MKANHLWSLWQDLLWSFAWCFTRPGYRRFVEWITGLVLNVEEHTITQSLIALDRPGDWKAAEWFAEYGAWDQQAVAQASACLLEEAPGRLWYGYHVWAGDDTKVHRSSKHVWGTCTFHEYTARCPNRAGTVRAHNWVVVGALLANPGRPAWYLPVTGLLSFRRSQLPGPGSNGEPLATFRTKNDLLVELARQQASAVPGPHLLVFDGAYAVGNVVRPLVHPEGGGSQIDFLTRLRQDARLYQQLPEGQGGGKRKWGKRLPPPRQGGRWRVSWQEGQAFLYGRVRTVRWKEMCCLWRVLGCEVLVKVVVAKVEGYRKRFTLVTSAVGLTGLQMVELFCARFRQEDGFRDQKQRLGWEECRAWTRQPIELTTQALFVCLTLLRMLQFRLERGGENDWWLHPPWNRRKDRPSVLDLGRLWWQHREGIQACLSAWLGSEQTAPSAAPERTAM